MLRLQQVFASKTAEFREALSAILGAKLAFYDNGQDGGGGEARMQVAHRSCCSSCGTGSISNKAFRASW
ncbi:hypothetical protein H4582DRAFT_1945385 [Lactarius indigo]|nr:hypothetical protein H4582DRAFT_1945385 [Lactarius indigo]